MWYELWQLWVLLWGGEALEGLHASAVPVLPWYDGQPIAAIPEPILQLTCDRLVLPLS